MKLVIVVEVEGIDPARIDPHEVAQAMLEEEPQLRYFYPEARRRFVRASWAQADADLDDVLDEEEE